jgi:hypothetical protein
MKKSNASSNENSNGVEIIDLADLNPDDKNARTHTPRGIGMIAKAIQEVGAARSGVIDENCNVLAGNATLDALAQAGIRKVKVVDAKGDEWVVVKRTGLSAQQKKKLALYDNRTSELSAWDTDILKEFNDEQLLGDLFFDGELFTLGVTDTTNDPNAQWRGMPEFDNQDLSAWKAIRVNFNSAESMEAFAKLLKQPISENTRSIWYPAAERIKATDKHYSSES